jgi:hypothetical protein
MGVFLRCSKPSSFSGLPEQKLNKGWVDFYCAWVRRCFSAVCGCRLAGIRVVRRGLLVLCVRVERKKKKKVLWSCDRKRKNKIDEGVGE